MICNKNPELILLPLFDISIESVNSCIINIKLKNDKYENLNNKRNIFIIFDKKDKEKYIFWQNRVCEKYNFVTSYIDNNNEIFVFSVYDIFSNDFDLILNGKYSKISSMAKNVILQMYNGIIVKNILNPSKESLLALADYLSNKNDFETIKQIIINNGEILTKIKL